MTPATETLTPLQKLQHQFPLSPEAQTFQKIQQKFGGTSHKAAFSNHQHSLTPPLQTALAQTPPHHPLKSLIAQGGVELEPLIAALGRAIAWEQLPMTYLGEAVSIALMGHYWQTLTLRLRSVQEALGLNPPEPEMPTSLETFRHSLETLEDTIALIAWAVDLEFPELPD